MFSLRPTLITTTCLLVVLTGGLGLFLSWQYFPTLPPSPLTTSGSEVFAIEDHLSQLKLAVEEKRLSYLDNVRRFLNDSERIFPHYQSSEQILQIINTLQRHYEQTGLFLINKTTLANNLVDHDTYLSMDVTVDFKCTYDNFLRWLELMTESGVKITTIDNVVIPPLSIVSLNLREKIDDLLQIDVAESRIVHVTSGWRFYYQKYSEKEAASQIALANWQFNPQNPDHVASGSGSNMSAQLLLDKAQQSFQVQEYTDAYRYATSTLNTLSGSGQLIP